MSRRVQMVLLIGLLALLAVIAYVDIRPPVAAPVSAATYGNFDPLPVENPALRLDLLERLKNFAYNGPHRSIFSASLPPPPPVAVPQTSVGGKPAPPAAPSGPPPLVVPATFFGYVTDARTGVRRAFFNEGDDVYVLGVGEVLFGRFRLLQIGNSTAELEEMATGRRTTLTMEEQPGPS